MPDTAPPGRPEACVQVLTAEVRVLVVGSRQVTLSVYRQLDTVAFDDIEPFSRVSTRDALTYEIWVVGRGGDGALVRCWLPEPFAWPQAEDRSLSCRWEGEYLWLQKTPAEGVYVRRVLPHVREREAEAFATAQAWRNLPLIVLAGLR